MKTMMIASLALLTAAAPAPLALAGDDEGLRGGIAERGDTFSHDDAARIARAEGMSRITETEQDDGKWELEGCTRDGREIEIDIDGRSGAILALEIDEDDDDC